jgi:MarR family transcriptional regulator, organic hydroperoxide resistance regulator
MRTRLLLHLVLHTAGLLEEQTRLRLAEHGIRQGQARVLDFLLDTDTVTVSELARRLRIAQPSATTMLQRMHDAGLVHRSQSADDARVVVVGLTAEGRRVALAVQHTWLDIEEQLTQNLTAAQIDAAHRILIQLRNRLGGESPLPAPAAAVPPEASRQAVKKPV